MLFLRYTESPAFDLAAGWAERYYVHADSDDAPIRTTVGRVADLAEDDGTRVARMVTWVSPYGDGIVGARLDGLCGVPTARADYGSLEEARADAFHGGRDGGWSRWLALYEGREGSRIHDGSVFRADALLRVWDARGGGEADPEGFRREAARADARRYRLGDCAAMALALHDMAGLRLGLVEGLVRDGPERWWQPCHAVAVLDPRSGAHVDVDGVHPSLDGTYLFAESAARVRLRAVSRREMEQAFSTEGVRGEDVAEAWRFAGRDPLAARALRSLGIDRDREYGRAREWTRGADAERVL